MFGPEINEPLLVALGVISSKGVKAGRGCFLIEPNAREKSPRSLDARGGCLSPLIRHYLYVEAGCLQRALI